MTAMQKAQGKFKLEQNVKFTIGRGKYKGKVVGFEADGFLVVAYPSAHSSESRARRVNPINAQRIRA